MLFGEKYRSIFRQTSVKECVFGEIFYESKIPIPLVIEDRV